MPLDIQIGAVRELTAAAKLLEVWDVSGYDEVRIVVDTIGGSGNVLTAKVEATVDAGLDPDMDQSAGWIQIASRDDFAPSKQIAFNDGASMVLSPVLWAKVRVSATKVTASPAIDAAARATLVGIPRS